MKRLLPAGMAFAWLVFFGSEAGGAVEYKYFRIDADRCPQLRVLDFEELLQATGNVGGRVVVRSYIDTTGAVYRTDVVTSAERSGPDAFWTLVQDVLRTWCYSQGALSADSYLDYLVVVNPQDAGGGGRVEIGANGLRLRRANNVQWTLNLSRPSDLARVVNIGQGDIFLREVPTSIIGQKTAGFMGWIPVVWRQLGLGFQIMFVFLAVALAAALVGVGAQGNRSWLSEPVPWIRLPLYAVKGLIGSVKRCFARRKSDAANSPGLTGLHPIDRSSPQALRIRTLWEWVIHRSHLESSYLPPLGQDTIDILRDLIGLAERVIAGQASTEDLERAIKGSGLVGAGGPADAQQPSIVTENDIYVPGTATLRPVKEIKKLLEELEEWAKLYRDFCNRPSALNAADKGTLHDLTWEHWCSPALEEALALAQNSARAGVDVFRIFEAGLLNHRANRNNWWTSQEVDRAVDRVLGEILDARRSTLDALWAVGAIAPLVGLFGTVWGISRAFAKVQAIRELELRIAKLAGDINVALSTTIVGLILAIISFLAYYWLRDRIERKAAEVADYFTAITNQL